MTERETILDTSGLRCPLPILHAKRALAKLAVGELLRVIATDPSASDDFDAMLAYTEHALLEKIEQDSRWEFLIRKG
ncbi:MAG: sulfurtransferase TusA family protein [Proteobacteria bacterium]|jgi:tRNA 2-thiouridine synthesizing protein A|nr:sulfurtransferase TusA family protein [Pseudomonadota bacterium]